MEFRHCDSPTVGIEWELQLLDSDTLDLQPGIMPLIEFFPDHRYVKPELVQSCVEIASCVAETSEDGVRHIGHSLSKILQRCAELGMTACGAGTHPFCRRLALITPTPRYLRVEKTAGYLAHTQITFSTHVHVGMRTGDDAMRAMSRLIPALPALIALSANSPFWRGHDTGHAAYRHRILAAAPNYGLPVAFDDWAGFERFYSAAKRAEMIRHFKDIHWGIRPHPDFGTLEIRTMDAASDLSSLHALVAFVRTLTVCMAQSSIEEVARVLPLRLPAWVHLENCYRASHLGLDATFICNERGEHRPLRGLVDELMVFCSQTAPAIGETRGMNLARRLLDGTPGYQQQLSVFAEKESARDVVAELATKLRDPHRFSDRVSLPEVD